MSGERLSSHEREAFAALPSPCVVLDGKGLVAFANREAERLLPPIPPGKPPAFSTLLSGDCLESYFAALERAAEDDPIAVARLSPSHRPGEAFEARVRRHQLGPERTPGFLLTLAASAEAPPQAPEAAPLGTSDADTLFRGVFEDSAVAMLITDQDSTIIKANAAATALLGYSHSETLLTKCLDLVHPDDAIAVNYILNKLRGWPTNHFNAADIRFAKKDGSTVFVNAFIGKIKSALSEQPFFVLQLDDVTERKWMETELLRHRELLGQQLREQTQEKEKYAFEARKLFAAVEQSSNSVVITDRDGAIEYVNPKFTAVTGYSKTEVLGQNPRLLNAGKQDPGVYRQFWETISSGLEWRGTFVNRRADGTLYHERLVVSPIMDDTGKIVNYIAINEDVTEQRIREEERKRLEARLHEHARLVSLGEMATGFSHEMNQPLFAINGALLLLAEELKKPAPDTEELQESLDDARSQLERIVKLAGRLRNFGRAQQDERLELDLLATINNAAALFENRLSAAGINLVIDSTTPGPRVNGNQARLEQAFACLIQNALYALEGQRPNAKRLEIELRLSPDGSTALARVTDNGPGVDAAVAPKIFDPFFSTKPPGVGCGLGLSTVFGIVKELQGSIELAPTPGGGATFLIKLPAKR